jgi:hypothetical protein
MHVSACVHLASINGCMRAGSAHPHVGGESRGAGEAHPLCHEKGHEGHKSDTGRTQAKRKATASEQKQETRTAHARARGRGRRQESTVCVCVRVCTRARQEWFVCVCTRARE